MFDVVLGLHIVICVVMVGLILLQRNEGGGLGMGGPSSGGMLNVRGQANFLTRLTALCAAAFMLTSIGLAFLAGQADAPVIIDPGAPFTDVPLN
ncbi:MAG: preprotein translocase subunit SecG [Pseudomonadota bacterium]